MDSQNEQIDTNAGHRRRASNIITEYQAAGVSAEEREKKAAKDAAAAVSEDRAKQVMFRALPVMAAAIRAPACPAEGLLVGVNYYAGMTSTLKARKGSQKMLAGVLSPLKSVVALAKLSIRRREGVVVTNSVQAGLRKSLACQVEQCLCVVLSAFPQTEAEVAFSAKLKANLVNLGEKLGVTPRPASSSSCEASATSGTRSCSSSSNGSADAAAVVSSNKKRNAAKRKHAKNVAPLCPGATFVPAHRPALRINPRAQYLVRSGAVCR